MTGEFVASDKPVPRILLIKMEPNITLELQLRVGLIEMPQLNTSDFAQGYALYNQNSKNTNCPCKQPFRGGPFDCNCNHLDLRPPVPWISIPESNTTDYADLYLGGVLNATTNVQEHKHWALGVLLAFFALVVILGNGLVITAICKERYLRTNTNYFIVSLAVADLLVGSIVMPFQISLEMLNGAWLYGKLWCDLWHSFDVLASTASIMNLCVISLDRHWAISDPISYPQKMTSTRVWLLIALVWLCSGSISFPAIAWWHAVDPDWPVDQCNFTEDTSYLVISSVISFYIPTVIMLYVYFKIYKAATAQLRSLKCGCKAVINGAHGEKVTLRIHRGGAARVLMMNVNSHLPLYTRTSSRDLSPTNSSVSLQVANGNGHHVSNHASIEEDDVEENPTSHTSFIQRAGSDGDDELNETEVPPHSPARFIRKRVKQFAFKKRINRLARERKAAKTLAIVIGVYVICWLPFFITNLLIGVCPSCVVSPEILFPVFTWMGYINSGMNPVIYAYAMKDFRRAFSRVICCLCPGYIAGMRGRPQYSFSTSTFALSERLSTMNVHGG